MAAGSQPHAPPHPPDPSPTIRSVTLAWQPRRCRRRSCSTLISLNNTNQTSAGKDKAHVGCSHAAAALSIGLARANRHERGNTRALLAAAKEGRGKTGGGAAFLYAWLAGSERLAVGSSVWQPPLAKKPSRDWLLVASAERVEPLPSVRPSVRPRYRRGASAGRRRCLLAGWHSHSRESARKLLYIIHNFAWETR